MKTFKKLQMGALALALLCTQTTFAAGSDEGSDAGSDAGGDDGGKDIAELLKLDKYKVVEIDPETRIRRPDDYIRVLQMLKLTTEAQTLADKLKALQKTMKTLAAEAEANAKKGIDAQVAKVAKTAEDKIKPLKDEIDQTAEQVAEMEVAIKKQVNDAIEAANAANADRKAIPGLVDARIEAGRVKFQEDLVATQKKAAEDAQAIHLEGLEEEERIKQKAIVDAQEALAAGQKKIDENRIKAEIDKEKALAQDPAILKARNQVAAAAAFAQQKAANEKAPQLAEIQMKKELKLQKEAWANKFKLINNVLGDSKRLAKVGGVVAGTATLTLAAYYGLPHLFDYLVQPTLVTETSKWSPFGSKVPSQEATIDELKFGPELDVILKQIKNHMKTAQHFNENLPNLMFSGVPGTGKTAFAKALARMKDAQGELMFDYALTTGSQFVKLAQLNLNQATKEFRKLLRWAQKGSKPMILFIDEADSIFSNRKLPGTPGYVTNFINDFLGLIQDKTQKNVCFIFATNHPFKLDDAILDRVGKKVEFTLPGSQEIADILYGYVNKFAKANSEALVTIAPNFKENLGVYAQALNGCSPRAIKFIAETTISLARRNNPAILTDEIAQGMLKSAREELEKTEKWNLEQAAWIHQQQAVMVR